MAVYTYLAAEDLAALIAQYDVGELVSAKGIAEGISNSNWLIETLKQPLAPVFYIIAYGVFGLLVMWPMAETNARRLDE